MDWRIRFRNTLAGSLDTPRRPLPATGTVFDSMENGTRPHILVSQGGTTERIADEVEPSTWSERAGVWWEGVVARLDVRQRRFGAMPLLSILLVALVVALTTASDVRRSVTGEYRHFIFRWPFLKHVLFNVGVAVLLLVFLAEFGRIRWDNWLAALGVAVGYPALLKSTFETPQGRALGLGPRYASKVKRIGKRLTGLRWQLDTPRVDFISYTNSRVSLRDVLSGLYKQDDENQARARLEKVTQQVDACEFEIDKRRVYARLLLDYLKWDQLMSSRLVPSGMRELELYDPAAVLREAASHCAGTPELAADVRRRVEQRRSASQRPDEHTELLS